MKPRPARQLRALLLKDLRLELRTRDTVVAMALFSVVLMVIFQFGFGADGRDLTPLAAGLLWVTIALTAVLGVGRSWVAEREGRSLDGLLAAPVSRSLLMVSKALAIMGYLALVELLVVPLVGVFFVREGYLGDLPWIFLVCLVADVGIGILGALVSSLATFTRARDLVLPVLFLPALVPLVIAASGATRAVVGGPNDLAEYRGYCLFLTGYAVLFGLVAYATYESVLDD